MRTEHDALVCLWRRPGRLFARCLCMALRHRGAASLLKVLGVARRGRRRAADYACWHQYARSATWQHQCRTAGSGNAGIVSKLVAHAALLATWRPGHQLSARRRNAIWLLSGGLRRSKCYRGASSKSCIVGTLYYETGSAHCDPSSSQVSVSFSSASRHAPRRSDEVMTLWPLCFRRKPKAIVPFLSARGLPCCCCLRASARVIALGVFC